MFSNGYNKTSRLSLFELGKLAVACHNFALVDFLSLGKLASHTSFS